MNVLKALLLCSMLSSLSYADQATDSFGTGFAQALQDAIQQRQNTQPIQQPATPQNDTDTGHYDAVDNYGKLGGFEFMSYTGCSRFVENSQTYYSCVWVRGD